MGELISFSTTSWPPMDAYVESFLPLFVAINVPGVIPIYLGLTEDLRRAERRRLTLQAMATAVVLIAC